MADKGPLNVTPHKSGLSHSPSHRCNNCQAKYVVETGRRVSNRIYEHRRNIINQGVHMHCVTAAVIKILVFFFLISTQGEVKCVCLVIKTGSTTQWQADLAPKEMAAFDMRNIRHVQPLLTWSTNAAHPYVTSQCLAEMSRRIADPVMTEHLPTSSPASSTITLPSSLLGEKKSASEKRHSFLRKFVIYKHMDFDYAAWQMLHLFVHPRRLYRSFLYRKRNKDQFARDDPAFLILVLVLILVLTVGFAMANKMDFKKTLWLHIWVYIDFFCLALIITTLFWYITNHYLKDPTLEEGDDIEWGYCFDVHINSYVPFATILDLYLIFYSCFLTPDSPNYRIVTILGNTMWMVALLYYLYINFMGYAYFALTNVPEPRLWQADLAPKEMASSDMRNRRHVQPLLTWSTNAAHPVSLEPLQVLTCPLCGAVLRNLQRGFRLLYPMTLTVMVYLLTVGLNWNLCRWIIQFWRIRTGSTTQWQADLAPKEMASSDMRNRRHVQPLLTWSTNAAHPVSLD
ncbi:UNC50 [Cordylochernes scorpioides]|uniref:UNC50 n=1 Tax=Cordylochernes scorpioides TaxID=51811 RepID=A0ABY6LMH7_9ARAC|nr:UNC50 [Cordylochernes scorpioides]